MRVPGAGSPALRRLLGTAPAGGRVLHSSASAAYVRFGVGPGNRVVGIVTRQAVHVPCAIATTLAELPEVMVGEPVPVREGRLQLGGLEVGVDRLVATTTPPMGDPRLAGRQLAAVLPGLDVVRTQLPTAALVALTSGSPAAVSELVGRGDGLTPVGDDVLAGWLVTTRAAGRPVHAVGTAALAHLGRTTDLSATLLAEAVAGASIPQFRAVLLAADTGRDLTHAVTELLSVGHTSGAGMLLGAALSLTPTPLLEGSPSGPRTR